MALTSAQAARALFGEETYWDYINWQDAIDDDVNHPEYYDCDVNVFQLVRHAIANSPRGQLPEPYVYKAFMNRLRLSGKLFPQSEQVEAEESSLVVASRCGHTIHPGNPASGAEACPPCVMEQCVDNLERIWGVWETLGAPFKNYAFREDEALYFKVKAIWRYEKTRWAKLVAKYEEIGEKEEVWEEVEMQASGYTFEELNGAQSCRAALQIARTRNPLKMDGDDVPFTPRPLQRSAWIPSTPNAPRRSCSPAFDFDRSPRSPTPMPLEVPSSPPLMLEPDLLPAPDPPSPPSSPKLPVLESPLSPTSSIYTPSEAPPPPASLPASPPQSPFEEIRRVKFTDGVEDNESRPLMCFHRISRSYKRGRHACPSVDGWEDTSFNSEPFFLYVNEDDDILDLEEEEANDAYTRALLSLGVRQDDIDPTLDSDIDSDYDSDSDSDSSSIALVDGENDGTARLSNQAAWAPWGFRNVEDDFDLFNDTDSERSNLDEYEDPEVEDIMMELDEDGLPDESTCGIGTRSQ